MYEYLFFMHGRVISATAITWTKSQGNVLGTLDNRLHKTMLPKVSQIPKGELSWSPCFFGWQTGNILGGKRDAGFLCS